MRKNFFLIIVVFTLYFVSYQSVLSQYNWHIKNSPTNAELRSVFFLNLNTGFVTGDSGIVLKTTNAGINWEMKKILVNQGPVLNYLNDVVFLDSNVGYAGGGGYSYALFTTPFRFLYKTTDQGANWIRIHYSYGDFFLKKMKYFNAEMAWAVSNIILKTNDGGVSWLSPVSSQPQSAASMYFIDSLNGFRAYDGIFKTTNGGINWNIVSNFNPDYGIYFPENQTGYGISHSSIVKTTNEGLNWFNINSSVSNRRSLFFINDSTGIVVGEKIESTTNGGQTWQVAYVGNLNSVFMLNDSVIWIVGKNGLIRSTLESTSSIHQLSISFPENFSLHQNYPNPFNPSTKIKFDIPKGSLVKLKIYDMLGREVATLVNEKLNPGSYEYEWNGMNLPSGVYFYKLESENFMETKRMVLVK